MENLTAGPIIILIVWSLIVFRLGMGFGRRAAAEAAKATIDLETVTPETRAKVENLVRSGSKIEAIKLLREDTGCGMAQAKWTVDAIAN